MHLQICPLSICKIPLNFPTLLSNSVIRRYKSLRNYGEPRSTTTLTQNMLATGKTYDSKHRGNESVRITGEDSSVLIDHIRCDDKILEYRGDLLPEVSRHENKNNDVLLDTLKAENSLSNRLLNQIYTQEKYCIKEIK